MHIYIINHNELYLIPHTITHYKKHFPNAIITICDNYSDDKSVEIAKNMGCMIMQWDTNNMIDDIKLQNLKNTCWKNLNNNVNNNEWVIICDMDEWLYINEEELKEEELSGTTILNVLGYNIIGDSKTVDLSDINVHLLNNGTYHNPESKNICFNAKHITNINYSLGAHKCNPDGKVVWSNKIYYLKHMDRLGLNYKLDKNKKRYLRKNVNQLNLQKHYIEDDNKITKDFNNSLESAKNIANLFINNKTIDIVVARYNEDLKWMDESPYKYFNYIVYNKGIDDKFNKNHVKKIINLENLGKCDHTYMYHIVNNYNNLNSKLADTTIFFPGSINMKIKHNKALEIIMHYINTKTSCFINNNDSTKNISEIFKSFTLSSYKTSNINNFIINSDSELTKAKLNPFGKWYENYFKNIDVNYYTFCGIFSVSKNEIMQKDINIYKLLLEELSESKSVEVGHYIERSWGAIFYPFNETQIFNKKDCKYYGKTDNNLHISNYTKNIQLCGKKYF